jgi:hypothetical protein
MSFILAPLLGLLGSAVFVAPTPPAELSALSLVELVPADALAVAVAGDLGASAGRLLGWLPGSSAMIVDSCCCSSKVATTA